METRARLKALCFPNNQKRWFLPPLQVSHARSVIFFCHKALRQRLIIKELCFPWKSFGVLAQMPKLFLFLCQGLVMHPAAGRSGLVLSAHNVLFLNAVSDLVLPQKVFLDYWFFISLVFPSWLSSLAFLWSSSRVCCRCLACSPLPGGLLLRQNSPASGGQCSLFLLSCSNPANSRTFTTPRRKPLLRSSHVPAPGSHGSAFRGCALCACPGRALLQRQHVAPFVAA